MDISVIIPAYNEEQRIEQSIMPIYKYLNDNFKNYEVIVVDDCSTDNTLSVVMKYANDNLRILRNEINRGKGFSVKRGILSAKYPLCLFSDSDLATPIEELERFAEQINNHNYDIVIASRNLVKSNVINKQPLYRQIVGKIFPVIVKLMLFDGFKDTQCGFKLFRTDVAKKIAQMQSIDRFAFDVEMLFIAKKMGYRIKEMPVVWIDKDGSTVRPMRDGFTMITDLIKIAFNDIRKYYKC